MEVKTERRGGNHRKPTGNVWKHTTMTLRPSQWNILKKKSFLEGKNTSRWAIELVKEYDGIPPVSTVGEGEKRVTFPLCFTEEELSLLKVRAEKAGMTKSQYFINALMDMIE